MSQPPLPVTSLLLLPFVISCTNPGLDLESQYSGEYLQQVEPNGTDFDDRTESVINFLIVYLINTGLFTACVQSMVQSVS